jgi:hypothetical protein
MNTAKSRCSGCGQVFTPHGYSQHIAKTRRGRCLAVISASQPQFIFQPSTYEQVSLTSTPNTTSWGYPDRSFGSENISGHDGNPSHLPAYLPLGNGTIATGNIDDRRSLKHHNLPYTNPL